MRNRYLLTLTFLLVALGVKAQSGKLYTVDRELSSSLINDIYQDHNQLIWIATEDGLNRYDGSKFTIYKREDGNENSLLNNYVRVVYEDSRRNLLIGFFNGLQSYDYATDTFRKIPILLEGGYEYGSHVLTIMERKNGDVLIGTSGQGLLLLKGEADNLYAERIANLDIPSNYIHYLYEDKDENLWISTQDQGLFQLNKSNEVKSFSFSRGISCNNISSMLEDKEGNLYMGSLDKGLFIYNKDSEIFSPILSTERLGLPINALYLSQEGDIYLGTEGRGLKIYDPISKSIYDTNYNVTAIDFSKAKVNILIGDASGNIWAGLFQKGVLLLPKRANNFKYVGHRSIKTDIIGSNAVTAVHRDHEGTLWVGTDGDGIYGISPDGEQIAHFQHSLDPNSVPSTIITIFEDSNHDLWIGSYLSGMAKLDRKTGKCEYLDILRDHNSDLVQRVFSIQEDNDKNLWIGTMGSSLFKMNLDTKEIVHYNAKGNNDYSRTKNIINNAWIDCLLLTRKGKLYIGTFDGLGCLDIETDDFVSTHGTNMMLPGHIIYSLYEDDHGTIWIGTSKGLMYIEEGSNQIQSYTTQDGLPSNVICAIKGDQHNNLWISTNYGISKMNLQKRDFINYYSDDGLQGNEFSKDAAFVDKDGQIIFGGINGITYFHPDEIVVQGREFNVRITDFYIHDKAVKKGMMSGGQLIIDNAVPHADTFHLSHNDNSFSIEFSAMEFNNPERITYLYAMGNDQWIKLRPGTNNVTFNNLSPGTYNFKVKAEDFNTYSDERMVTIIISPAWYFSVWAKITYAIIIIGIIALITKLLYNRYRTRKKMQEHIHAKQINEAKLQFFINIAHEIRTPMTLIISPLKKLISSDKEGQYQNTYRMMYRNSERILSLINQLMDVRKIDKGQMQLKFQETEIIGFIKDICIIFEEQFEAKKIALQFNHDMDELHAWVDPKNFDKIILNVLANAMKFTPEEGRVEINLTTGTDSSNLNRVNRYFEISISNTGNGIKENELEHIFECFYQSEDTKGIHNGGTGIGLHLSRSIAQLHKGSIKAENNAYGQGCRFVIRMPLGNEHLSSADIIQAEPGILTIDPIMPQVMEQYVVEREESKVKTKSKYRILVVDDDLEIRNYISQELGAEYHITTAPNGKEAFSIVLKEVPDLIISDIMMPEMDGITLCRKIKQHVNINHIPIILLTAKSEEEDNLEGLGTGADAYIVKPFNLDILDKTIQNIIRNREILRNSFTGNQQQEDKVQKVQLKSSDEKLMEKIMDIINENLSNPALSVEMLANEIGISRVHLHRKTKELTNQSTRDFIRNIRLQQAANLLATKNISISEVAYAVGFTNLATFSSAFKEFYGETPSNYMEMHLKMQA